MNKDDLVDGVHRAMRVELSRETEVLESRLSFLATVGSTSPYVGLFGTVWGIMNSFRSLGAMQSVSIATVAPGISEALIATAMGLFAGVGVFFWVSAYRLTEPSNLSIFEYFGIPISLVMVSASSASISAKRRHACFNISTPRQEYIGDI